MNDALEAKLRLITDALPVLISYVDREGRYQFNNATYEAWFNISRNELKGRRIVDFVGEEAYENIRPHVESALAGIPVKYEATIPRPDGTTIVAQGNFVPHTDGQGETVGFYAIVSDITDRKLMEEKLRHSETESARARSQLVEAIESLTDGFALYDADDRLVLCNARYRDIYKKSEDLLVIGARFEDHIRESAYRGQFAEAIGREQAWVRERVRQHQNPDGTHLEELGNGRWLRIAERKTKEGGVVGVRTDITEHVQAEEALRQRVKELTLLNQIGDVCSRSRAEDALLEAVTNAVAKNLFPDNCGFLLLDADRGVLVTHPSFVLTDKSVDASDKPLGSGVTGRVAQTGVLERIGDVRLEKNYIPADSRTLSELCLPIEVEDRVIGVLNIESDTLDAFTENDEKLLSTVVDLVGNALQRIRATDALRQSRERLRLAIDATNLGPWEWNIRTGEFYFSPEWKRQIGYEPHEIPNGNAFEEWQRRIHPEDRSRVSEALRNYLAQSRTDYSVEFRLQHKDGSYRWMYTRGEAVRDSHGKPTHMYGCHVDITERRAAEEILRKNQETLASIAAMMPQSLYVFDIVKQENIFANREVWKELGYSEQEIERLGPMFMSELMHPEDLQRLPELISRWDDAADGDILETEYRMRHADGSWRWFLGRDAVYRRSENGRVQQIIGTARDVTVRKETEQKLVESESRLRSLIEAIPDLIFRLDQGGRIIDAAVSSTRDLLMPRDQFLDKSFRDVLDTTIASQFDAAIERARASSQVQSFDYDLKLPDGRQPSFEARIVADAAGGAVVLARNISERKEAERQLKLTQHTVDFSADAVFHIQEDGSFSYVNQQACRYLGYSSDELLGMKVSEINLDDRSERWPEHWQETKDAGFLQFESIHQRKDGSRYDCEIRERFLDFGGKELIVATVRDISERNKMERELRSREAELAHVGRLSLLGEVAAEITHEILQPIYAIGNYASACRNHLETDKPPQPEKFSRWLDSISNCVETSKKIIHQIGSFAAKAELPFAPFELDAAIRDVADMLAFDLENANAIIELESPSAAQMVASEVRIKEVFANLIHNACESFQTQDSVDNTILVRVEDEATEYAISVIDNGPGVDQEMAERMFDSFVTTKSAGTGMGLSICKTIIDGHGGKIWARPQAGGGVAVHIRLPKDCEIEDE